MLHILLIILKIIEKSEIFIKTKDDLVKCIFKSDKDERAFENVLSHRDIAILKKSENEYNSLYEFNSILYQIGKIMHLLQAVFINGYCDEIYYIISLTKNKILANNFYTGKNYSSLDEIIYELKSIKKTVKEANIKYYKKN